MAIGLTFLIGYVDPQVSAPTVPGVNVIVLQKPNVRGMFYPLLRYLMAEKPAVIFSAEDHLNALVLLTAILHRLQREDQRLLSRTAVRHVL